MGDLTSDQLDTRAKTLGGFRSYYFKQGLHFQVGDTTAPDQGKMYKMVLRRGQPMGGVCATLCAFWSNCPGTLDTACSAMMRHQHRMLINGCYK
jgi:hypothetical protein